MQVFFQVCTQLHVTSAENCPCLSAWGLQHLTIFIRLLFPAPKRPPEILSLTWHDIKTWHEETQHNMTRHDTTQHKIFIDAQHHKNILGQNNKNRHTPNLNKPSIYPSMQFKPSTWRTRTTQTIITGRSSLDVLELNHYPTTSGVFGWR